MVKKIIIAGICIFTIVIGIFAFLYYKNGLSSGDMLSIAITGPKSTIAGDEVEYIVEYKNNSEFLLEKPKLTFEFPSNSLTEDGKLRFTKQLDDIAPGSQEFITFKTKLLGKEGDIKVVMATLSYMPYNLSVRYEARATLSTTIDIIPIGLVISLPEGASKGQEITYFVKYASLIEYPMENMSIRVDMGNGFTFTSSSPKSLDNREWKLNTLQKSSQGIITIKGIASGDVGVTVPFTVKLGMWQNGTFVVLKETTGELVIVEPLLLEQSPVVPLNPDPTDGLGG